MCSTVLSLIGAIPDVIWSGLIASALTLSGVLISNRSNTARLKIQLKHDAEEKAKERTGTLRREVYLRTVEELVKANAHLASLPRLDIVKVNLADGLQGFFSAAARLQLVAEPTTALLVNKLSARYGELLVDLMAYLMPACKAKTDVSLADNLYSESQAEIKRILSEMARLNESGQPNPQAFQTLQSSLKFQTSQSQEFAKQRSEAWSRFNTAQIAFQKALLAQLRTLVPQQFPVLVEIRKDLGLTGSLDELEKQLGEQMKRIEEKFDALISSLQPA